jgi:hypothetical protein
MIDSMITASGCCSIVIITTDPRIMAVIAARLQLQLVVSDQCSSIAHDSITHAVIIIVIIIIIIIRLRCCCRRRRRLAMMNAIVALPIIVIAPRIRIPTMIGSRRCARGEAA